MYALACIVWSFTKSLIRLRILSSPPPPIEKKKQNKRPEKKTSKEVIGFRHISH